MTQLADTIAALEAKLKSLRSIEGVRADIEEALAENGLTIEQVYYDYTMTKRDEPKPTRTRATKSTDEGDKRRLTPEIKYRNPLNPDETWTGRGKKAKWLADALVGGAKLEDFEVQQ